MKKTKYIIFSRANDYTSKIVADWLAFYSKSVSIFYTDSSEIQINTIRLGHKGKKSFESQNEVFTSNFNYITYFRSGMLKLMKGTNSRSNPGDFYDFNQRLKYFFTTFELCQKEIIDQFFKGVYVLGKDNGSRTNKLINLSEASRVNLKIPKTILTTSKSELLFFYSCISSGKVITKSLDIGLFFGTNDKRKTFQQLTQIVDIDMVINEFPDTFPPTLFQEQIEKIIELRIFFLDGKIWSSALLSQANIATSIDSRNYDLTNMNRVLPFSLPVNEEKKIQKLMQNLSMETGSIDMILSKELQYYFLEVNPGGQFTGYSEICNYNLEMEIAKHLITHEK